MNRRHTSGTCLKATRWGPAGVQRLEVQAPRKAKSGDSTHGKGLPSVIGKTPKGSNINDF